MKRTSFLFASLTAIALLSCSSDNLTSTAEDVNYPQTPALQKIVPPEETINAGSTTGYCNPSTVSVSGVPNGSTTSFGLTTCTYPSVTGTTTKVEICIGSSSGNGNSTLYTSMQCGVKSSSQIPFSNNCAVWNVSMTPVPTTCTFRFHLKCNSGGPCSTTLSGLKSWIYYN